LLFFRVLTTPEIYTLSLHDALPIYRTMQDHLDSVEEQLGKLIPTAMRVQRRLWLGSIMEPFLHKWAEAEEANGGLLDEAKRNELDRKSTRLNSSHVKISYAVFCLKK